MNTNINLSRAHLIEFYTESNTGEIKIIAEKLCIKPARTKIHKDLLKELNTNKDLYLIGWKVKNN